ncbi:MAG: hypothetical protein KBC33_03240 [Candidatus Pacebacteria bacterium]|nr:hypothetical protein [Candidatus Paceibacterota bacterium]
MNDRYKTVLVVGDSSSVGPGAAPEETIAGRLAATFGVNVVHLSVNGAKTGDIIHQVESVSKERFALTIIHAGNNDITHFTRLNQLKNEITTLFDKAKHISDEVVVFRGGNMGNFPIFPVSVGWIFATRSKQVRDLFMEIAREKSVLYVEKFMSRKDDIFLKRPHHFYCWDLVHLNGNGYKVWFDYLIQELRKNNMNLDSQ